MIVFWPLFVCHPCLLMCILPLIVYITAPHIVPIPTLTTIEERQEDSLENLEPGKTVGPTKMILADTLDMSEAN